MNRALQIAHLSLLAGALIVIVTVGAFLCRSLDQERVDAHAFAQAGLDAVADLRRPCKGPEGPDACGLVSTIKKAVIKAGDAIVTTQKQEQDATSHATAAMDALRDVAPHVSGITDTLSGSAAALTETAHGATAAIATTNQTIAGLQPLEEAAKQSVKHLDAVIADPAIPDTLGNTAKITADAARITKDAADEADKLAHPPKVKLGFWGALWAAVKYVHQLEPPLF